MLESHVLEYKPVWLRIAVRITSAAGAREYGTMCVASG